MTVKSVINILRLLCLSLKHHYGIDECGKSLRKATDWTLDKWEGHVNFFRG